MEIKQRKITGVLEIQLSPRLDERGFFVRTFDSNIFNNACLNMNWVQENHSRSISKGIIRGLHFQFPPFAETKLVRCVKGEILDVFVDLRANSKTFGHWDSIILSENNFIMMLIPRGFAHGFLTLTDGCDVLYKVDNYYNSEAECGIIWNDKTLNIQWPISDPTISVKDSKNLRFNDFIHKFHSIKI